MSSATDVLMYVDPIDAGTMNDTFNPRLAEIARFEAHPFPVPTGDFSGPNVFYGNVWAFGADYLSPGDIHDVIRAVRWKCPHRVVAVVNWWDGPGACETHVLRPDYTVSEPTFYGDQDVEQQVAADA